MGQYHLIANLTKKQVIDPHRLGCGLKLWEQLAAHPGTGTALLILIASASNGHGGGDICEDPVVGSWRGDIIVMVGDYDDDSTYPTPDGAMTGAAIYGAGWEDISDLVAAVIERELDGKFVGDGWRQFQSAA